MMWTQVLFLVASCVFFQHTAASFSLRDLVNLRRSLVTCAEHVREEKLKDAELPIADKEYPQCDKDGNYQAKQCFGRHTQQGECHCVNPLTGKRMDDIVGLTPIYRSLEAYAMTCRCALDYSEVADRAKYCDLTTGDYKPVACIGSKCACAERWGALMESYEEFTKGESNCLCARKEADSRGMMGLIHTCNKYGGFEPIQCKGSQCSCVNEEGSEVGDSVHIAFISTLEC